MNAEELSERLRIVILSNTGETCWTVSTKHLLRLVNEAVEQERESCAQLAHEGCRSDIARKIRARGNHD